MKYKIFALIGEAGSGKDTVMKKILEQNPLLFNEVISCTTRPPREGEAHGVNYYYYSEEEFAEQLLDDWYPDIPEFARRYFDIEQFARDLFAYDYTFCDGYVFSDY